MIAKDLISDIIPALTKTDTGKKALTWMEIFRISHLPIVHNDELLGLICDADIYDFNMVEESIGNHTFSLPKPYIICNQHIYEVIDKISQLKLSVIPVLSENHKFMGVITLYDLLHNFSSLLAVDNPGGIIVLELYHNDYSLSQISQIVESNGGKVLSLYVHNTNDPLKVDVTLKLNQTDLSSIIQTFHRYSYNIKKTYMAANAIDDLIESRYNEFLNYLSI